jgi:hypothetical protein
MASRTEMRLGHIVQTPPLKILIMMESLTESKFHPAMETLLCPLVPSQTIPMATSSMMVMKTSMEMD